MRLKAGHLVWSEGLVGGTWQKLAQLLPGSAASRISMTPPSCLRAAYVRVLMVNLLSGQRL